MAKYGFYFDNASCCGCRSCQVACKDKNDLDIGVLFRRVVTYETGVYPTADRFHHSAACNHCSSPACVANCPTGTMYIDDADGGTVQHNDDECIGCQSCVKSCPYSVPTFIEEAGIARKCDACIGLRQAGEKPACVATCWTRALDFGDVEELEAKYGSGLVRELPFIPEASHTEPSTLIRSRESALNGEPVEKSL